MHRNLSSPSFKLCGSNRLLVMFSCLWLPVRGWCWCWGPALSLWAVFRAGAREEQRRGREGEGTHSPWWGVREGGLRRSPVGPLGPVSSHNTWAGPWRHVEVDTLNFKIKYVYKSSIDNHGTETKIQILVLKSESSLIATLFRHWCLCQYFVLKTFHNFRY